MTNLCEKNILSLAYLGDAVMELYVRQMLIEKMDASPGELVKLSKKYITCEAQSDAVERVLPHLSQEELGVFKRGRNAKTHFAPKHASIAQYRRATGFEALFGYLHLAGNTERAKELFDFAYNTECEDNQETKEKV